MILMPLFHLLCMVQLYVLSHVFIVPLEPLHVPGMLAPLPVHLVPKPVNLSPVDLIDCFDVGVLLPKLPASPLQVLISSSHCDEV